MASSILSLILLASFSAKLCLSAETTDAASSKEYDVIIFAQNWPTSNCIEWKEKSEKNTCNIPPRIWTVHGIWPSKNGEIGPGNCDPSLKFDPSKVKPILPDLEAHWTNVHANTAEFGFWKHEWEKHGTCAQDNEHLRDEFKYFSKGVEWNEKFPLSDFLISAGVTPGGKYTWQEIFNAVQKKIDGKNPSIQCDYDRELKEHTLAQINICFDKSLQLIDCDKIHGGLNQGCPKSAKEIVYPHTSRFESGSNWWIALIVVVIGSLLGFVAFFIWKRYFSTVRSAFERI